jgi:thioredoxin-related protein
MVRTSFLDPALYDSINKNFDLVDFNPEITDTIFFKGKAYVNARTQQAPFHQLAVALCHNGITLPSFVVLDEQMNVIDAVPYYLNPEEIKNITAYYGSDIYKKKSWTDFMAEVNKK